MRFTGLERGELSLLLRKFRRGAKRDAALTVSMA